MEQEALEVVGRARTRTTRAEADFLADVGGFFREEVEV